MGLWNELFGNKPRCGVCGEKRQLHRREPPVCERCYNKWHAEQIRKNTGLVRERKPCGRR